MGIRRRYRVIWGGMRLLLMMVSTRRSLNQSTYRHLLLFRVSPSGFREREADKNNPAPQAMSSPANRGRWMQSFDVLTNHQAEDLANRAGPELEGRFYQIGAWRRQTTDSRCSGCTGRSSTDDGPFESSEPPHHRQHRCGPRSDDRNPVSADLSELFSKSERSLTKKGR